MAAYIVGMITGAICLIFPMVYLMNIDRCMVKVLQAGTPAVEQFLANTHAGLAYGTAVVGAIVLLLSAALTALAGGAQLRRHRAKAAPAPEQAEA